LEKLIQKRTREMNRVNLALKESQRTISTLVSNLPGMAYRCLNDRAWTLQYVSEGCREITGYGVQDLLQNYKVSFGEEVIHPQ
ncbi:MAG: hypothetical protein GWM98_15620, partial [Nitrospinaceae bacterium]|nr:PAS domain-containing protein [Nitrospinaceae bacterium]NIR55636.1 PAS domain-containing protein [Nitrospinaceae bacterium]NIS86078.1 PAS domain-containing protein [Nitrospinaceae bacterium]NIT82925.1 PAS domain-containing protein [Nitrospinaceae bacterium]NIU45125.1 PAS domain-containing protein [Nitrospinaceae bacterium]